MDTCVVDLNCSNVTSSFVSRLSSKQISNFLNEIYPKEDGFTWDYSYSKKAKIDADYIHVSINTSSGTFTAYLDDYESNISHPSKWLKFMRSIFGDDYFKAYLSHCANIFDED